MSVPCQNAVRCCSPTLSWLLFIQLRLPPNCRDSNRKRAAYRNGSPSAIFRVDIKLAQKDGWKTLKGVILTKILRAIAKILQHPSFPLAHMQCSNRMRMDSQCYHKMGGTSTIPQWISLKIGCPRIQLSSIILPM